MTKQEANEPYLLVPCVSAIFAGLLAAIPMLSFNLSALSEKTGLIFVPGLIYGLLYLFFNFFTSRFFSWLYT